MGIYNVAVFGRSVTLALQTMRSVDRDGFNKWYASFVAQMENDPLLGYFTALRNEILKEGPPAVYTKAEFRNFNTAQLAPLIENPPPGAKANGWFVGDTAGGSGWFVELPDGTTAKYYVPLPDDIDFKIELHLPDAPRAHLGQRLADTSIVGLCRLYVKYLTRLVYEAEHHFGS